MSICARTAHGRVCASPILLLLLLLQPSTFSFAHPDASSTSSSPSQTAQGKQGAATMSDTVIAAIVVPVGIFVCACLIAGFVFFRGNLRRRRLAKQILPSAVGAMTVRGGAWNAAARAPARAHENVRFPQSFTTETEGEEEDGRYGYARSGTAPGSRDTDFAPNFARPSSTRRQGARPGSTYPYLDNIGSTTTLVDGSTLSPSSSYPGSSAGDRLGPGPGPRPRPRPSPSSSTLQPGGGSRHSTLPRGSSRSTLYNVDPNFWAVDADSGVDDDGGDGFGGVRQDPLEHMNENETDGERVHEWGRVR